MSRSNNEIPFEVFVRYVGKSVPPPEVNSGPFVIRQAGVSIPCVAIEGLDPTLDLRVILARLRSYIAKHNPGLEFELQYAGIGHVLTKGAKRRSMLFVGKDGATKGPLRKRQTGR